MTDVAYREAELAKGETKLASGDFKGTFKILDNLRYGTDTRMRAEVTRMMRELAGRTDDDKLAKKASELADTIELQDRERAALQAEAAEAQQRAYDERTKVEGAKRYKVLTQKDRFFSEKFDPEKLEAAVNAYADQGWRVVSMATASIPGGLNQHREEIIILMTREPHTPNGS